MPPPLSQLIAPTCLILDLDPSTREAAVDRLLGSLGLEDHVVPIVQDLLAEREAKGSTALGSGVALPHVRADIVPSLRLAYGRSSAGIDWDAPDGEPVHHLFLLVAPSISSSKDYLPVMGNVARLVRDDAVREKMRRVETGEELLDFLKRRGC